MVRPPPRLTAEPLDLVGAVLDGRYRLDRLVGEGGMAAVYEAQDSQTHDAVAVKVLNPTLARREVHLKRFLREANAASSIRHINVVGISHQGEVPGGSAYFVMELLRGRDLAALVHEHGAQPWSRVREIAMQILSAMGAAHAVGIVHRDLKPSNCFLVEDEGGQTLVKVLDFGIAKVMTEGGATALTGTDDTIGSVHYMAPEQVRAKDVDTRTDVYALGVLMFELLTGQRPFDGPNAFAILTSHCMDPPPRPRSIVPTIPAAVEAAILKALEKAPADRFQTMDAFQAALPPAGDEPTLVGATAVADLGTAPTLHAGGPLGGGRAPGGAPDDLTLAGQPLEHATPTIAATGADWRAEQPPSAAVAAQHFDAAAASIPAGRIPSRKLPVLTIALSLGAALVGMGITMFALAPNDEAQPAQPTPAKAKAKSRKKKVKRRKPEPAKTVEPAPPVEPEPPKEPPAAAVEPEPDKNGQAGSTGHQTQTQEDEWETEDAAELKAPRPSVRRGE